jgi:hypothetical protein
MDLGGRETAGEALVRWRPVRTSLELTGRVILKEDFWEATDRLEGAGTQRERSRGGGRHAQGHA